MLAGGGNIVLVQSDDGGDDGWWRWLFVLDGRDEMKGIRIRDGTQSNDGGGGRSVCLNDGVGVAAMVVETKR